MKQIVIDTVTKSYGEGHGRVEVLRDIGLEIGIGEILVLLGKSGSGKSTFLNLVSGIDTADTGRILHNGHDLSAMDEEERTLFRRKNLGFIFQFFNLIPTLTVMENLLLPLQLNDMLHRQDEAVELLERLGIPDKRESYADALSGGEQQRVAIARAVMHDPGLVLADEPTGNLDDETSQQVVDLLLRFIKEKNRTLVLATHNREICHIADRMFRIKNGSLLEISAEIPA